MLGLWSFSLERLIDSGVQKEMNIELTIYYLLN